MEDVQDTLTPSLFEESEIPLSASDIFTPYGSAAPWLLDSMAKGMAEAVASGRFEVGK